MFRAIRKKIFRFIVVSGAGAAASYFLDKESGPERRAQAKEKANDLLGRAGAGGSWQPQAGQNANGFEPPVMPTPAPPPATVVDDAVPGMSATPAAPGPSA